MDSPAVTGLRSRSRSKTPFADGDRVTKSGRKTPGGRNTPVQHQLSVLVERATPEPERPASPPARRTRAAAALTSDYSSEESPDRTRTKEHLQNKLNAHYEYSQVITTKTTHRGLDTTGPSDFFLTPSQHSSPYVTTTTAHNASLHRSHSPAHSACSTDSSFAEQALAELSRVTERERSGDHLPYKLYKMAGEYWNKYPKTDYTYSPLSRDRVELAPGQVAVPNMSRRSLAQYRTHGDLTSSAELDLLRQQTRTTDYSSEEECVKRTNGNYTYTPARPAQQRWWLTRLLIAVYTTVTTTITETVGRVAGRRDTYAPRYTRLQEKPGLLRRGAAAAVAPLVWIYTALKTVVTTTTTTVTNTLTGDTAPDGRYHRVRYGAETAAAQSSRRRLWPWLLLLPLLGYASHYTYENYDKLIVPDFSNFTLELPEFTVPKVTFPFSLPNLTVPNLNLSLPELDLTLPEIDLSLPEMPEMPQAYYDYKDLAHDRIGDATEYMKVVASSCLEEARRYLNGLF